MGLWEKTMGTPTIYGIARSTYVRSARWAFEEKGVDYDLVPPTGGSLTSSEYLAIHPFAKIPALEHDRHHIYEAAGICTYVDEAFEGPALQPADALGRAKMRQWISVATAYLDPAIMRGYVFPYAFAEGEVDQAKIDAGLPNCERYTHILDDALAGRDYLAGDQISIAEFIIAPMIVAFGAFKEGKEVMASRTNLARAVKLWTDRPAYQATLSDPAKAA